MAALCAGSASRTPSGAGRAGTAAATCRTGRGEARRALIADWARERGIGAVALGHTLDDQAETLLLRLARGSGRRRAARRWPPVDAAPTGILWLRPLLGVAARRRCARWLAAAGRRLGRGSEQRRPALRPGAGARRAAARSRRSGSAPSGWRRRRAAMARARGGAGSGDGRARRAACLTAGPAGDLALDPARARRRRRRSCGCGSWPAALGWVSGAVLPAAAGAARGGAGGDRGGPGRPRADAARLRAARPRRGRVAIRREPARVAPPVPLAAGRWDGRWQLVGAAAAPAAGLTIGALGRRAACAPARLARRRASAREALVDDAGGLARGRRSSRRRWRGRSRACGFRRVSAADAAVAARR